MDVRFEHQLLDAAAVATTPEGVATSLEGATGPEFRIVETSSPWDSRKRWPLTVANALGHQVKRTYDDATGQP